MSERVTIGHVKKAHGVRGLLRVRVSADLPSLTWLYLNDARYDVRNVTRDKEDFLVELAGVADRNAAEALQGSTVAIDRAQLPPLDPNEIYVADLIGCRVADTTGADLGEVIASEWNGAQELLEVKGPRGTFLLPFVDAIVTSVDVAAKRIVCDPPEGLIELNQEPA